VCAGSTTPSVVTVSPLLFDKPWFLKLRENLPLHSSYLPLGVPNGLLITTHKDLLLPRQLHATALFWRHHQVAGSKLKRFNNGGERKAQEHTKNPSKPLGKKPLL
jgi:hypothetical protein